MRRWLAIPIALFLLAWTGDSVGACSMGLKDYLRVRCGDQEIQLSDYGRLTPEQQLADLSAACGTTPAALAQFVNASMRRVGWTPSLYLIQWSRPEESRLWTEKDRLVLGECFYRDYERVDDWLIAPVRERPYCYDANAGVCCPCPSIQFSPSLFAAYLVFRPNRSALLYALALVLLLLPLVKLRRAHTEVGRSFRPWWLNTAASIAAAITLPLSRLGHGFTLPVAWIDAVCVALLAYLLASLFTLYAGELARILPRHQGAA